MACGPKTRDVEVDRYDVTLSVLADGSMDVSEEVRARAVAARARFVRRLPARQVDRILDVEASINGAPASSLGGEVRIDRRGSLEVVWLLPEQAPYTLKLHYRLDGALAASGTRGLLYWNALPAGRPYTVGASRINIDAPSGSSFTVGPWIDEGQVPVSIINTKAHVQLTAVVPTQAVLLTGEIDFGATRMGEPDWQLNAARALLLMPAFVSAGVCLIAIAIGVVVMIRLQYGAGRSRLTADARRTGEDAGANREMGTVVRGLGIFGLAAFVVGAIGAIALDQTLSRFGTWPMAIPLGLLGMGAVFLWEAARLRQYTSRL